jgi:hypothetical protein
VQIEKVIKNRIYELSDVEVRKAVISLILVLVIGILLIGAGGYVIGKLKGHRI